MEFIQFEIWQQLLLRYQRYDYVINIITDKTQRLLGTVSATKAYHHFNQGSSSSQQGDSGSSDKLRLAGNMATCTYTPKCTNE